MVANGILWSMRWTFQTRPAPPLVKGMLDAIRLAIYVKVAKAPNATMLRKPHGTHVSRLG